MFEVTLFCYYPDKFFDKNVNEEFVVNLLLYFFDLKEYRRGDPEKKEPDLIIDGCGIDITFADETKKIEMIKKLKFNTFNSNDIEKDVIECIKKSAEKKSKKKYVTINNSIAILVPIPVYDWWAIYEDSYSSILFIDVFKNLMEYIKNEYIVKKIFTDIILIFPSENMEWHIVSVIARKHKKYVLSYGDYINHKKPYFLSIPNPVFK